MNNRLTALTASLMAAAIILLARDAAAQGRDPLFRIVSVSGKCQAMRPTLDAGEAATAKMYPLGTLLRLAAGAEVMLSYQNNYGFHLTGPAEVLVAPGVDKAVLQVVQTYGKIRTDFVQAIQYGDVLIEGPAFSCMPGPECHMTLDVVREDGGMVSATIVIDRGEARINGPHYDLPVLKACTLRIQSALDRSLTRIVGVLGEFPIQVASPGEVPEEYAMKPNAVVKISRRFAPLTGREGVAVLIVNELGVGHASYSFIPGDAALSTTGTLREPPKKAEEEAAGAETPAAQETPGIPARDTDEEEDPFAISF